MSAIQSSKQLSWATSEHAHGERHGDVDSSSSVSSLKHIQHLRGSSSSCGAGAAPATCASPSNSVCESTDCVEKLLVRGTCSCSCSCRTGDDSAGGVALRCDAGRWGGRDWDAMCVGAGCGCVVAHVVSVGSLSVFPKVDDVARVPITAKHEHVRPGTSEKVI
jgi:hypothetical protein